MNLKGWPFEPFNTSPEPAGENNGGGPGAPG